MVACVQMMAVEMKEVNVAEIYLGGRREGSGIGGLRERKTKKSPRFWLEQLIEHQCPLLR